MSTVTASLPISSPASRAQARTWGRPMLWTALLGERLALGGLLVLAAALRIVGLEREVFANTYYAAAVKSMLTGWHAFFFASFDSAGFVTVDKPPVGLWVQAISAKLFGFSGLSLLLPQAIAGVLAVAVLYWLVRRAYGPLAGVLAGLALAVTPISVVTDRNNTMDAHLVLVLLLAAWAATLAAERGRLRPLLLCAGLVGLAYNIKMLQAYLVLPAFWAAYLLWAPVRLRSRLAHLSLATVVLLAVSLSWSAVVDLTPATARPYVGSSGSNSALSLALGYNGLGRLTSAIASRLPIPGLDGLTVDLTAAPGFAPGIGNPGPLRLFSVDLAGQASWLLPLAVLGVLAAGYRLVPRPLGTARPAVSMSDREAVRRRRVALTLWAVWLAGTAGYFSVARFYHVYYLIMLGPGISALAGIGVAAGWHAYREGWRLGWMLPGLLLVCAGFQGLQLSGGSGGWTAWLPLVVLAGAGVAILGLVLGRSLRRRRIGRPLACVAVGAGCLALLAAPLAWSVASVESNAGAAWLPQASAPAGYGGFRGFGGRGGPGGGPRPGFGGPGGAPGFVPNGGRQGGPGQASGDGHGAPDGSQQAGPGQTIGDGQRGPGNSQGAPGGPGFAGPGGGRQAGPRAAFGGGQGAPGGGPAGPGAPSSFAGGPGGPGGPGGGPRGGGAGAMTFAGDQWDSLDAELVEYLRANQGAATFLVATPTSSYASLFILATDQPAMALGGYQGWDRILTPERLADLVSDGTVRFFWMNGGGPVGGGSRADGGQGDGQTVVSSSQDATADLLAWVRASCVVVPAEQWQSPDAGPPDGSAESRRGDPRGQQLYDCGTLAARAALADRG